MLETQRLNIIEAVESDIKMIIELEKHKDNRDFVWSGTYEEHKAEIEDDNHLLLIFEEKDKNKKIGFALAVLDNNSDVFELRRIVISKKGIGYGREVISALMKYAFEEKDINRFWLDVYPHNAIGIKLYERLGMYCEGILRKSYKSEQGYLDKMIYSKLKEEYFNDNKNFYNDSSKKCIDYDATSNWRLQRAKKEKTWEEKGLGKTLLPLDDALDLLLKRSILKEQIEQENISLWDAGGRVLNCDIKVEEDVPPFDRSPLDGYALRSKDTLEAQPEKTCSLKVLEEVPAGHTSEGKVEKFTAIKVLTGAPIPPGADAVIRYEEVKKENNNILVSRPVSTGEGVAPKGEDFSLGECVLKKGTVLGSAQLGVLASLGIDPVPVNSVPKIGIFCTGDELVDVKSTLNPGKIRVTNLYSVSQLISKAGGKPVNLGIVPDNLDAIKDVYQKAEAMNLDLVISTGGVSVGDYDVVKDAMLASGFENLFWKIAIRPGAPVAVSEKNNKLWIGLSGNPAGAIIVSLLLVVPVVAALAGKKWAFKRQKAELEVDIHRNKKGKGLGGFWWAQIYSDNRKYMVRPFKDQHCGVMKSYLSSNCLLKIPAGKVDWPAGTEVEVWMLP